MLRQHGLFRRAGAFLALAFVALTTTHPFVMATGACAVTGRTGLHASAVTSAVGHQHPMPGMPETDAPATGVAVGAATSHGAPAPVPAHTGECCPLCMGCAGVMAAVVAAHRAAGPAPVASASLTAPVPVLTTAPRFLLPLPIGPPASLV